MYIGMMKNLSYQETNESILLSEAHHTVPGMSVYFPD